MDESINKLKQIGVKEISKTTKISINKLEDILEKRFTNLQRIRAVGFLNILEREYKVDLSQWLQEYDENVFVYDVLEDEKNLKKNNLDLDTQKSYDDLLTHRKKESISKGKFYIAIIVAIVIILIYFGYKSLHNPKQNQESSIQQTQEDNESFKNTSDTESSSETPQETQEIKQPVELTQPAQINTPSVNNVDTLSDKTDGNLQITISPDKDLWIQIINLDNDKTNEVLTTNPYTINLDGSKELISFGHGEFSLTENNQTTKYDKPSIMRFLYIKGEGLKQIKYADFLKLRDHKE